MVDDNLGDLLESGYQQHAREYGKRTQAVPGCCNCPKTISEAPQEFWRSWVDPNTGRMQYMCHNCFMEAVLATPLDVLFEGGLTEQEKLEQEYYANLTPEEWDEENRQMLWEECEANYQLDLYIAEMEEQARLRLYDKNGNLIFDEKAFLRDMNN